MQIFSLVDHQANGDSNLPGSSIPGGTTKQELLEVVEKASRLAGKLYSSKSSSSTGESLANEVRTDGDGAAASAPNNLSSSVGRSVSSAGDNRSLSIAPASAGGEQVPPALPKRAETFGGFDQQQQSLALKPTDDPKEQQQQQSMPPPLPPRPDKNRSSAPPITTSSSSAAAAAAAAISNSLDARWDSLSPTPAPMLARLPEEEQRAAALTMTHYLNNITCMVTEHFTSLER